MLDNYNALIGRCRTINQVNQVHIALCNAMTPGEVVFMYDNLFVSPAHAPPSLHPEAAFTLAELRDNARLWFRRRHRDLLAAGKDTPEPFLRRDLHKHATFFGDGAPPDDKILLVALPGANYQIMTAVPTFLQNLDASRVDLVIVRDGTRTRYLDGIEGIADSVEAFADTMPDWLGFKTYRRVCGIGVSAGALPTLIVGLRAGVDDLLAVGPSSPRDVRWDRPGHEHVTDQLRRAAADGRKRNITVAYGADCDEDRVFAGEIAELIPIKQVVVSDPHAPVGHVALRPLAERGELSAFLREHLRLDE